MQCLASLLFAFLLLSMLSNTCVLLCLTPSCSTLIMCVLCEQKTVTPFDRHFYGVVAPVALKQARELTARGSLLDQAMGLLPRSARTPHAFC